MIIKLSGAAAPVTGREIPLMPPLIIIGGIELFIGHQQNLIGRLESARQEVETPLLAFFRRFILLFLVCGSDGYLGCICCGGLQGTTYRLVSKSDIFAMKPSSFNKTCYLQSAACLWSSVGRPLTVFPPLCAVGGSVAIVVGGIRARSLV